MKKGSFYGVGVNDVKGPTEIREQYIDEAGNKKTKTAWRCPYYRAWTGMLERCYSEAAKRRRPTYAECSVCDEWLIFSVFKAWMQTQDFEGKHLDKDILSPGNKVYSPSVCVFVTHAVNNFITDRGASRGKWRIGVNWHQRINKFEARCHNQLTNKSENLGYFGSEEEAHEAWRKRKHELACQLAEQQTDSRVAQALIQRYASTGQEV